MLAEIFLVRLEATALLSQETRPLSDSRFVPFILGAQNEPKAERENAVTRSIPNK